MTDKTALRHLHALLKTTKWQIKAYCPDIEMFFDLSEVARHSATVKIMKISFRDFHRCYKAWRNSEPIRYSDNVFADFLNDLAFEFGRTALRNGNQDLYTNNCYLKLTWL